jgi:hypothetical protein
MSTSLHLRRFTLERYAARDLPEDDQQTAAAHLESCGLCRDKLSVLLGDIQAFQQQVPYQRFRVAHERRKQPIRRPRWSLWLTGLTAVTATSLALVLIVPTEPPAPTERLKGAGVALGVLLLQDGRLQPLQPGAEVPADATLQLTYTGGGLGSVALIGIDSEGAVTTYYPESETASAPLPAGDRGAFPFSLTLDGVSGIERFYAVFAAQVGPLAPVQDAARKVATRGRLDRATELPLPASYHQASGWVVKVSPSMTQQGNGPGVE